MSESKPQVMVLIIAWNRVDDVTTCLESFDCVSYPSYRVVVVDNASEDATVATVRERFPWATLICNEQNLGYVGGTNVGFRYALEHGFDYVLVLNQDTKMTPTLIDELVRVMEADPRIGIAGAKNLLMQDPSRTWGRYGILTWGPLLVKSVGAFEPDRTEESPKDVDWVIGNGCLLRREALERVGLFDQEFFHLEEDVEWCTRAREKGYRVVYVDTAAVLHKGSSSADPKREVVFTYAYFMARNAILFARRHASPWQWVRLVTMMTLGLVLRVLWYVGKTIHTAVIEQRPFVTGMFDGFSGRLRRELITVRRDGGGSGKIEDTALQRFLRWIGV